MTALAILGVLSYATLATAWDLRQRRIPNWLSAAGLSAALAAAATGFGVGIFDAVLGATIGFALLFVPFALGVVGGGDVKYVAVVGAWLGPRMGLEALLLGTAAGLVVGLGYAAAAGRLRETVRSSAQLAWLVAATMAPETLAPREPGKSVLAPIPYALPLSLGVVLALWLDHRGVTLV